MSDLPAALPSPHRSRLARRLLLAVAGFLLIAVVAGAAHSLALRRALGQLHEASRQRLEVESARLDGLLSRFDYLPSLLETSLEVLRLLDAPENPALRREVSRYLKALNAIAGADNLYVLDASGSAVAAADFDQAGTPMGQDLSYRPYMREALAKGRGAFYGVGITSRRAGYYLSYAMPGGSRTRGVATVKVDLQALERGWRDFPGGLMMLDEHSVVILASREEWKYRPRVPLSEQAKAEAARSRRYGSSRLQPLLWRSRATLPEGASRVIVDARPYLATELPVNDGRWRLVLLADEAASVAAARWAAASAGLSTAVLLLVIALASQRRRAIRQRLASREALQAAYDSLEAKVQERTA
ncbi:MAG TPA: sensor histidine kinase, partial [Burkholderiaceae bacterium]|nr:sensor histidine kinase [Burkholderiaceae bacterium]